MGTNKRSYWTYRLALEKLKQKTWLLVILARILFFLGILASYYWR